MPYNILGNIGTLELTSNATTDNACCILTLDNIVTLMGNITLTNYTANTTIATLADQMLPSDTVKTLVCANDDVVTLTVDTEGNMSINQSYTSATLYLNGVCFNVCDTYYNSAIGNNFLQGTSPIR